MSDTTYISTSGGLFSAQFVEAIRGSGFRDPLAHTASFALPWAAAPREIQAASAEAWEPLLERWDTLRAQIELMDVSQVRSRWLLPLFKELGFDLQYQRGDVVVGDDDLLCFALSHRGWAGDGAPEGTPIVHTVAPAQGLDARMGKGIKNKSPHDG